MTPEHHEERLRMWAASSGRPVLSIDYGKAPEYPYPFAIDEAFDTYRVLVESSESWHNLYHLSHALSVPRRHLNRP